MFLVRGGRLRLLRHTRDGRAVTLAIARAGELFAEAALFSACYHCDAVADLDSAVAVYPTGPMLDRLRRDPALALEYMRLQARRLQALRARLELREVRRADERTLQYLYLLSDGGGRVAPDRPLKDMAGEVGLSHEAFYRALAALERAGAIRRGPDGIDLI